MGIPVKRFDGIPGCVGELTGGRPGPTVLLRADIDALSIAEKTGLPFASKNEGKMHACGHDCHIAIALGAARMLSDIRETLPGRVKFFFQSGEEVAKGAQASIKQGVMEGVDACFGLHIWSQLDSPRFNLEPGERMASCDSFDLVIRGDAAHGSAPHQGHDAIVAASAVIMALQSVVSRRNDPLNALVLTIGTLDAGQRFNIIADRAVLQGTVRTYSRKFRLEVERLIRQVAADTAQAYGCAAQLDYHYMTGPVINDDRRLVELAQSAARKVYGDDILVPLERMTGSEDFAFLQEEVPGIYGFLGTRSASVPGSGLSNHHEQFTPDEDALRHGAAIMAQFAVDFLGRK